MFGEKNYKMSAPRAIWMENLFVIGTCGRWYWAHSWMILCMISDIDYVLNCFVWSGYFSKCIIKAIPSIRFLIKRIFSSWLGDESVLICQGLCGEPDRTTGTPPGSDIFIIWTNGFRDIYYFLSSRIRLSINWATVRVPGTTARGAAIATAARTENQLQHQALGLLSEDEAPIHGIPFGDI